jgi:hypothetical protein
LGAVLALVAASAASATAATMITSAQIKDGTIQPRDLSPAATTVTSGRIKDATIQARDLSPKLLEDIAMPGIGAITTEKITLVTGPVVLYDKDFPLEGGVVPQSNAVCPEGAVAINGWIRIIGSYIAEPAPFITSFRQDPNPSIWSVSASWPTGYPQDVEFRAIALCAGP